MSTHSSVIVRWNCERCVCVCVCAGISLLTRLQVLVGVIYIRACS